ncbi:MAG: serine/threonine protein kinase [Pirellulaceae bacterium]|nr:serine/threonine protein kinase [Pirellulaceae bacterium]
MFEQIDVDESLELAELLLLSEEQQTRLAAVLDEYLCEMERGEACEITQLQNEHPDLADVLELYLDKLNLLVKLPRPLNQQYGPTKTEGTRQRLGDFTLLNEIGRGGMGVVYEAHQASLNRRVAIKLLPLASMLDAHQIARFQNEAHAAGLLQHANIVPVYSVGFEQGIHFFAMQFIDGMSIDAWIRSRRHALPSANPPRRGQGSRQAKSNSNYHTAEPDSNFAGTQSWRDIVAWGATIADALHAAHEAGVVHRDVKPSNLMLDHASKIWITDFGLARCQTELSLTRSGDVIGTMRYMSPEQARGQNSLIDGRADVYSLAATLYEMLTLRPAHDGDDAASILKKIDEQEVQQIRRTCPDLPRDLETVISKAMSKSREGRYSTAEEFSDDLNRVLHGEPTQARPATIADRIGRFASKHRSVVFTGALIVALGFVGLAVYNANLAVAKQSSDASAARATRGEKLARDAVDRLGAQTAELLSGIPAADSVRRQLLTETLDYYERFAAEVKNDPKLREDLAITLGKAGALQSELGDSDKAIASLTRCESIYSELANQPNVSDSISLNWSTSQNNLAQALVRVGKLEDAARYFARASLMQEKVVQGSADGDDKQAAKLALGTTLNNLGLLLTQTEAIAEAEQTFLKAIRLLSEDDETPHAQAQQQLAAVYANLSGLLTTTSPERAVEYALLALSGQLDSLEAQPSNAKLATQTIVTLNTLGAAQSAASQNTSAVDTFRRAIEIGRQLLARWPDQPTYRRDLVLSYNHLGLSLSKTHELAAAQTAFDQALVIGRPLATRFADDAETQSMLGGVLNNLGFLCQQLGDPQAASDAYQEAVEHQSTAVRLAPEVKRYRQYLKKHQENYETVATTFSNNRRAGS